MPDWSTVAPAGTRTPVTGAAGGLWRALAGALTEVGAEVVGIIDLPGRDATVTADLADDHSAGRAAADAVARLGGLDAVVGAAGGGGHHPPRGDVSAEGVNGLELVADGGTTAI